eukprot:3660612-Amphidinium_carterae.2
MEAGTGSSSWIDGVAFGLFTSGALRLDISLVHNNACRLRSGVPVLITVDNGEVSWDRAGVRSRQLADIVQREHWDGGVCGVLQFAHDLGASGLWLYKQLSMHVAQALEAVLSEVPEQVQHPPLGQGKTKRRSPPLIQSLHVDVASEVSRSVANTRRWEQIVRIASDAGWKWTAELGEVARFCYEGIGSTKLVEDGVRTQRYGETSRNQAHRLSDARAYSELIQKRTATDLHKWPEPAYRTAQVSEGGVIENGTRNQPLLMSAILITPHRTKGIQTLAEDAV